MQLELNDDEAQALHDVLTSFLSNLPSEIRHTDSPTFRSGLRERRDELVRIRNRLTAAMSAHTSADPGSRMRQ